MKDTRWSDFLGRRELRTQSSKWSQAHPFGNECARAFTKSLIDVARRFVRKAHMRRLVLVLSVVGLLSLSSSHALATPLFIHPAVWSGNGTNVGVGLASQTTSGGNTNGFVAFDNFSFAAATTFNEVTWFGFYLGSNDTDGPPHTSRWDLLINADNAGAPGLLIGGQLNANVLRTTLGLGLVGVPVTVYQFTAEIPTFTAAAGTAYWLAPV